MEYIMQQIRKPYGYGGSQSKPIAGFTLLEMLVSLCLICIAFIGILATYTTSMSIHRDVDERSQVLFLTQKTLEEVLSVDYVDLPIGTTVEIFEEEVNGLLTIISKIERVVDNDIHTQWRRFTDPTPNQHYKKITIQAVWGLEDTPPEELEKIVLSTYRVERENTVDFSERASSQLPWN